VSHRNTGIVMNIFRRALDWMLSAAALAILTTTSVYASPKPLFASEEILKLRIEAPFSGLIRAAPKSTAPFDGKLSVTESTPETLAIQLSARGISRRNPANCDFPPLKIEFKEKPGSASLFKGQKSLKLVTHCRSDFKYQDYNLLEYAAYKLLNILTPASFRVRLAEIDYVEAGSSSVRIHRRGFLVEDSNEMAERNSLKEVKADKIEPGQLSASATARSDLFQYLIGNLDWSDLAAVPGTNCCHNVKLLGTAADSRRELVPVAYDFDSSGFVNAPYANPPTGVPVTTVRSRYFRGLCQFNTQTSEAAHQILQNRAALLASINETPALSDSRKRLTTEYLEAFFSDVSDPGKLQHQLLDHCRG
jgi:hypothetical protein